MKPGSKYEPLYLRLRQSGQAEVTLTFAQVEALLGRPLPTSAQLRGWWSNRGQGALQSSAWMEAGYEVVAVDLERKRVTFSKSKKNYMVRWEGDTVAWDGELLKALRQHMNVTQGQLAELLGVRQQTVSEWEQGVYRPTRASAKHIMLVAERAGFKYGEKP